MSFQALIDALCTVVAIPVTPFVGRGSTIYADFQAYAYLLDKMVSAGIRVVTPNGNTGEFYSLTQAEMRLALEATMAGNQGRALVLAGVGFDTATAIDMAEFAAKQGAQAVMVHNRCIPIALTKGGWPIIRRLPTLFPTWGLSPMCAMRRLGPVPYAGWPRNVQA